MVAYLFVLQWEVIIGIEATTSFYELQNSIHFSLVWFWLQMQS